MVSIIIPVYNAEIYLCKCLESVINQTYNELEIILVNDGSKDDSFQICSEYAGKDNRIIVIDQENQGVSHARNRALSVATGDYIFFCDADDVIDKDLIQLLVQNMEHHGVQCSCCGSRAFNDDEEILPENPKNTGGRLIKQTDEIFHYMLDGNGYLWNKLFIRKIIVEKCLSFDESLAVLEDEVFLSQYFENCKQIYLTKDILYYYRQHCGSALHTVDAHKLESSVLGRVKVFCIMQEKCQDKKIIELAWNQMMIAYFHFLKTTIIKHIHISERNKILEWYRNVSRMKYVKKEWKLWHHGAYLFLQCESAVQKRSHSNKLQ